MEPKIIEQVSICDRLQIDEKAQFEKWDNQVGILILYDDNTRCRLLTMYPVWLEMPQREEISLMINGGCIFYKYKVDPFVFGLQLRSEDGKMKDLSKEEWDLYMDWFARFGDLVIRGNYEQAWYKNLMDQLTINPEAQYVKSFFGVLSNLAFYISKQEDGESKDILIGKFKQILTFESNRDYVGEMMNTQRYLQEIANGKESHIDQ